MLGAFVFEDASVGVDVMSEVLDSHLCIDA